MVRKIRFDRIIIYIIIYIINLVLYRFFHSHFLFTLFILMTVAPVLSILLVVLFVRKLSVRVSVPYDSVKKGEIMNVQFTVINPSVLMSLDVGINTVIENMFHSKKFENMISLPARIRGEFSADLPLVPTLSGILRIYIKDIQVLDIMGFFSLVKKVDITKEVIVMPDGSVDAPESVSDVSHGMTESEESVKRGNDFSDVNDVREYIPGDRLMSIHWKLSAKKDELMVKDRVSMSDQQLVVVLELAGNDEEVESCVSLAYALAKKYVKDRLYVKLMWWSEGQFEFKEKQLISEENVDEAFAEMFYDKIYSDYDKAKEYMRSIKPEIKAFVRVYSEAGIADAEVVENE